MAKSNYTKTQLAVCDLCDEVRNVLAIHPNRVGWVVRPRHTERQVVIDHKDSATDAAIAAEVQTLRETLETLNLVAKFGYTIVSLSQDDSHLRLPLFGGAGGAVPE
jgi:hypothetical protein